MLHQILARLQWVPGSELLLYGLLLWHTILSEGVSRQRTMGERGHLVPKGSARGWLGRLSAQHLLQKWGRGQAAC